MDTFNVRIMRQEVFHDEEDVLRWNIIKSSEWINSRFFLVPANSLADLDR